MVQSIHRIRVGANCYLLKGHDGYVLIDTATAMARRRLVRDMELHGCREGDLGLIIVTHGDPDHIGNCVYLKNTHGAVIAIHELEAQTVMTGDMECSRKKVPDRMPWSFKLLEPLGARFIRDLETFQADLFLEDGQSLAEHGLDATVYHLPGHSKGSLAVLTAEGDLFCGDLLWNLVRPRLHPLLDDVVQARASLDRIRNLPVNTIHPGHGRPFSIKRLPCP